MAATTGAPLSLFAALSQATGEALNTFCGLRLTRLAQSAPEGAQTLCVERAFGLPQVGRIAIDNVPYSYTGIAETNGTAALLGVHYFRAGVAVLGTATAHEIGARVVDSSGTYSVIDRIKRAIYVDTAEGEDLSALGRNLGVLRLPSLQDDAQFRALIKVLAYNPRGTLYGLQLVLDALVGAGNYTLREDPENAPCQVFVTIPGALFLNAISQGKAYLTASTLAQVSGDTVKTVTPSFGVQSVRLPAQNFYGRFVAALPGPANGWVFAANAADQNPPVARPFLAPCPANGGGKATTFDQAPGAYSHSAGPAPGAAAALQTQCVFFNDTPYTNDGLSFGAAFYDGALAYGWGCLPQSEGPQLQIGLVDPVAGNFLAPGPVLCDYDTVHDITLQKDAAGLQSLWLNGALVQAGVAATAATSASGAKVGALADAPTPHVQLLSAGMQSDAGEELLNIAPQPDLQANVRADGTLKATQQIFMPADDGKRLRIQNSQAQNTGGGNNNGNYTARYQAPDTLGLYRDAGACSFSSTTPTRLVLDDAAPPFVYPDDLGKALVVYNSARGNAGSYTIARLLDADTARDCAKTPQTRQRQTRLCEIAGASFVTESDVSCGFSHVLTAEENVDFVLIDAATHSQSAPLQTKLTLPAPVPVPGATYALRQTKVQTAQIYESHAPFVKTLSQGVFSAMPFYVSDPTNFVRDYLQYVVAAGVHLVFNFS